MAKLNQIIAIEKTVKADAERKLTDAYHASQKNPPFQGVSRTYLPKDDNGEQMPPESTLVQIKSEQLIAQVEDALTRLFDVTATKETANCKAHADVVVGDKTILKSVPATTLIFLEKQLEGLKTFVSKLPTLDPSEEWTYNVAQDVYASKPAQSLRMKKTPRNHVKAEATQHHPAQVELYYEDVPQGTWTTIKFSGAMPVSRVNEILERIDALRTAVKFAREEANNVTVEDVHIGKAVLGYLFAK